MDDKDKWIEDVLQSMDNSKRAQPRADLFESIKSKIHAPKTKVISINRLKHYVAAASILIIINVSGLVYYNQSNISMNADYASTDSYQESLISSYNIYE